MKIKLLLFIIIISTLKISAQVNLNSVTGSANSLLGQGLSNDKIINGLKEALSVGAKNAANKAGIADGFYKNPLIKIPFPEQAKQMQQTLNSIGMSKQVDSFIKTMNHAAEDAAQKATPIFIKAITNMSITDGLKLLRGGDNSATEFLKASTTNPLKTEFKPVIKNSLQKVQITKYWNPLVTKYNRLPMVKKMNPDLEEYVTSKTIDGLFILIAQEELKIRKDPKAQVSNLLLEVFGRK